MSKKCSECGSLEQLLCCSKCEDLYCKFCNENYQLFYSCYICDKVTCENCDGCHFCDFCGSQDNFLCEDHQIPISDLDKIACPRKECLEIVSYLDNNETDEEKWTKLVEAASNATGVPLNELDRSDQTDCGPLSPLFSSKPTTLG